MKYLIQTIIAGVVAYYLGTAINDAYVRMADRLAGVRTELHEQRRIQP